MRRNRNCCTFPDCPEPKDKERDAGLCTEHALRWLRSDAFAAAARDHDVRFAMSISKTFGLRELAKHRLRWAKAEAAREEAGDRSEG
jgi:hypothetical protein